MGKCTVHDSSSMLKYLPIFSDDLDIYRDLLVENNIVYITVKEVMVGGLLIEFSNCDRYTFRHIN